MGDSFVEGIDNPVEVPNPEIATSNEIEAEVYSSTSAVDSSVSIAIMSHEDATPDLKTSDSTSFSKALPANGNVVSNKGRERVS